MNLNTARRFIQRVRFHRNHGASNVCPVHSTCNQENNDYKPYKNGNR
ncbi:hypothetical protein [Paenibacillus selenitireducens]|nr:hypothetical protein [Paenibacillus selenitireducens]